MMLHDLSKPNFFCAAEAISSLTPRGFGDSSVTEKAEFWLPQAESKEFEDATLQCRGEGHSLELHRRIA